MITLKQQHEHQKLSGVCESAAAAERRSETATLYVASIRGGGVRLAAAVSSDLRSVSALLCVSVSIRISDTDVFYLHSVSERRDTACLCVRIRGLWELCENLQ